MQALRFTSCKKQLELVQKDVPEIKNPKDVLVKVAFAGICGTDLHILQGEFPCESKNAFTPGHEFSGVVVAVGDEVKCVKPGDKIAVDPNNGCQVCQCCHSGDVHYCKTGGIMNTIGIFRDGGWAEYAIVPDVQIHKVPETISLKQAALIEPLSCITHGWDRITPVTLGQNILIIGAGIIGNLWLITLNTQGHRRITISEPNVDRLATLKKSFPDFDYVTPDILKTRRSQDNSYGFDLIIDCSGNNRAMEQAFDLTNKGAKLCLFGVAPPEAKISISPFDIYIKELTILGVYINPHSFPKAMGLAESLSERYLNYDLLGVQVFKLSEYANALELLQKGKIAKAVFTM